MHLLYGMHLVYGMHLFHALVVPCAHTSRASPNLRWSWQCRGSHGSCAMCSSRVCASAARERLLSADARIIPCAIQVHVVLVESAELASVNVVSKSVAGLNLYALNALSHRTRAVRLASHQHAMLTHPATALTFVLDDPASLPALEGASEIELMPQHDGTVHAIVAWFTATLERDDDDAPPNVVSTAPGEGEPMRGYSWGQCAHFLPTAQAGLKVTAGTALLLRTHWSDSGLAFTLLPYERANVALQHLEEATANVTRAILFSRDPFEDAAPRLVQARREAEAAAAKAAKEELERAKAEERAEARRAALLEAEKRRLERERAQMATSSDATYQDQLDLIERERAAARRREGTDGESRSPPRSPPRSPSPRSPTRQQTSPSRGDTPRSRARPSSSRPRFSAPNPPSSGSPRRPQSARGRAMRPS